MKFNKPNFFIVGVGRSGTTTLAKYLNAHPEIYIPKQKELRYFVKDEINKISRWDPLKKTILSQSILDKKQYFDLLNNNKSKLVGDASIHYFNHYKVSIKNIKNDVGDVPIIIILRNPVDRLISNWKFVIWDLYNLKKAISFENNRKNNNYNSFWFYKEQSMYYEKVKAFKESFSKVKIFIFEDLFNDINKGLVDCQKFLNVNPMPNFNYKKALGSDNRGFNSSKDRFLSHQNIFKDSSIFNRIENPLLYFITAKFINTSLSILKKININQSFLTKKDVDQKFIEELYEIFKYDIEKLENLISKDLTSWKLKND